MKRAKNLLLGPQGSNLGSPCFHKAHKLEKSPETLRGESGGQCLVGCGCGWTPFGGRG